MQCILSDFLILKNPKTPVSVLIQNLNAKCAHLLSHNRACFEFDYEQKPHVINYYGLTFAGSGIGKGKSVRDIDSSLMNFLEKFFEDQQKDFRTNKRNELETEAKQSFLKNKSEQNRFIKENMPRTLAYDFSEANTASFVALREAFQDAEFGGTFLLIDEFGDFITYDNTVKNEFISAVSQCFDYGDLGRRVLKGEKNLLPYKRNTK